jgi:hypothetical protein
MRLSSWLSSRHGSVRHCAGDASDGVLLVDVRISTNAVRCLAFATMEVDVSIRRVHSCAFAKLDSMARIVTFSILAVPLSVSMVAPACRIVVIRTRNANVWTHSLVSH